MQKTYEDLAWLGNVNSGLRGDNESHRENMRMNETMDVESSLKARRAQLVETLKSLGVERVEVDYDGCGDSGDVQDVRALKGKKDEAVELSGQSVTVEKFESVYDDKTKEWTRKPYQATATLKDALGDFAVDFLAYLSIDWYNNEGGCGTVMLHVEDGEVRAEHNTRYESSEYSEHVL